MGRATPHRPSWLVRLVVGLVVGGLLVVAGKSMFESDYLEAKQVMHEGVPGTFTLDSCVRGGGTNVGPETRCTGSFHAVRGDLVLNEIELSEKHDASGLDNGDTVPARAHVDKHGPDDAIYRDDDVGHGNLTQNGIGRAGLGVVGLMVAGLGVLSAWRSTGTARRTVKAALVTGLLVGVVMWIGGMTAGGGVLT